MALRARVLGAVFTLAAAGCAAPEPAAVGPAPRPSGRAPSPVAAVAIDGRLEKVIDGDTLLVSGLGPRPELVRLIGIDAPETGDGRTVRECFGPEARAWLAGQVPRGSRVRLVSDVGERDRFGRRLAYAYRPDGAFLNAALVENGFARTMTIRPNVRHAGELRGLERRARAEGRGLWAACVPR